MRKSSPNNSGSPADQSVPGEQAGEQAYRAIKDDIVLSRLAPGATVTEAMLESRYGFSRAAIRRALAWLIHDGLVSTRPRSGHRITSLSLDDIDEVFLLRRQLEPLSVRLAAGRIDRARMEALDRLCQASYTAGDTESEARFLDANRQFHIALAHASGLPRLARMVEALHNEAARILYIGFRLRSRSEEWSHGHETLLEALLRPDPDLAERIARDLLDNSYAQVRLAALESPALLKAGLSLP